MLLKQRQSNACDDDDDEASERKTGATQQQLSLGLLRPLQGQSGFCAFAMRRELVCVWPKLGGPSRLKGRKMCYEGPAKGERLLESTGASWPIASKRQYDGRADQEQQQQQQQQQQQRPTDPTDRRANDQRRRQAAAARAQAAERWEI